MGFPRVSPKAWKLICSGEVGATESWREGHSVIKDVRVWLINIENLPKKTAVALLKEVVHDFPYFHPLLGADFPPLYLPQAFEDFLSGFLYVTDNDEWSDWIRFRLYIDTDQRKAILGEFKAFWKRIKDIDPRTGKPRIASCVENKDGGEGQAEYLEDVPRRKQRSTRGASTETARKEYVDDVLRLELAEPPGTITNSIGMKLVPIPAGTFIMGSPEDQKGRGADEVQHEATLTKDFYLGMMQVTQAQYERVMIKNPSIFQGDKVFGRDSSEFPVESISWEDAIKFCEKLSSLPEEESAGHVYRLPTETEWEYACRAGSTTVYSFGDSSENLSDYAWHRNNSDGRPHPVALKKPNAWGLHDMHGNAWEWCSDWYDVYPNAAVTDPVGPIKGTHRVLRGGSWGGVPTRCRSADRLCYPPHFRDEAYGFRIALSSASVIPR